MTRTVWVDGQKFQLSPVALLGQGGEAEVYDLGGGRVVKWWKPPDHPDFEGLPDAQAAARRRISEAPDKLRSLPDGLPAAVVTPSGLALAARGSARLAGYVMAKVAGTALQAYGEPRWRREHPVAGADVVAALLALHDAIAGLHRAGVVVGDCNDLNVLVDGRRVYLIDVDSYQFGGHACSMFSERFLDPRLCDGQRLVPVRPHDADSDWFAFAAMTLRSLLGVGPWGGVHRPPTNPASTCPAGSRALRRLSVLSADVVYPRAARPVAILPTEFVSALAAIFERDVRGPFPRELLERLDLRACAACGEEHGRRICPACQAGQPPTPASLGGGAQPVLVRGHLTWTTLAERPEPATRPVPRLADAAPGSVLDVWLSGDALMRRTPLGGERVGSVLAGQTQAWVGQRLGVGFYRAGGLAVGFVFRPDRGALDDRVVLPRLRGRLVDALATVGEDRAWLWLVAEDATTCVVVGADGRTIGAEAIVSAPWLPGIGGACASGGQLFVPTDEGIARVEFVGGHVVQTRLFAETQPLVGAGDQLVLHPGGIDVIRRRDAIRLFLT